MDLTELVAESHMTAINKGWWLNPRSPLEIHALIHSEISEATEEVRNGRDPLRSINGKPEGEAIELVDGIIRIADYFGYQKWDLDTLVRLKLKYNETRSHRHGGKLF